MKGAATTAGDAEEGQRLSNAKRTTLSESEKGKAPDKAAAMVGVNPHYVTDAKNIEQDAPEILEQVKHGKLNIPQAKKMPAVPCDCGVRRCPTGPPLPSSRGLFSSWGTAGQLSPCALSGGSVFRGPLPLRSCVGVLFSGLPC
jgi:hypothetical protein